MRRILCGVGTLTLATLVSAAAVEAQVVDDDTLTVPTDTLIVEDPDEEFDEEPVRTLSFGIAGGASVPAGNFGDSRELGFHGNLLLGLRPANWPVGLRAEGMFHRFTFDGADVNNNLFAGVGNVVFTVPTTGVVRPYLIGGAGVYNFRFSGDDFEIGEDSRTEFGINGGGGIAFQLSGFDAFLEARFHNVFLGDDIFDEDTGDAQFVPLTFGVVF